MQNKWKDKLINAIEDAQINWQGADWRHELRVDGKVVTTDEDEYVYCEGGSDNCSYCAEAVESAERASEFGDVALSILNLEKELSEDRMSSIEEAIESARREETEWGHDPTWGPVLEVFSEALHAD